jgi:hypothetical protein
LGLLCRLRVCDCWGGCRCRCRCRLRCNCCRGRFLYGSGGSTRSFGRRWRGQRSSILSGRLLSRCRRGQWCSDGGCGGGDSRWLGFGLGGLGPSGGGCRRWCRGFGRRGGCCTRSSSCSLGSKLLARGTLVDERTESRGCLRFVGSLRRLLCRAVLGHDGESLLGAAVGGYVGI